MLLMMLLMMLMMCLAHLLLMVVMVGLLSLPDTALQVMLLGVTRRGLRSWSLLLVAMVALPPLLPGLDQQSEHLGEREKPSHCLFLAFFTLSASLSTMPRITFSTASSFGVGVRAAMADAAAITVVITARMPSQLLAMKSIMSVAPDPGPWPAGVVGQIVEMQKPAAALLIDAKAGESEGQRQLDNVQGVTTTDSNISSATAGMSPRRGFAGLNRM